MKFINFLIKLIAVLFVAFFVVVFVSISKDLKKQNNKTMFLAIEETKGNVEQVTQPELNDETVVEENEMRSTTRNENTSTPKISKFYYSNLDSNAKMVYNALSEQKSKLRKGNENINLPAEFGKAIDNGENIEYIFSCAVNAFEYDNPELYYLDLSKMTLYYEKNAFGDFKIYLKPNNENGYLLSGFSNEQDVISAQRKINEIVNEIRINANEMESDYDKILYVHDWLTENVKYDETISKPNKDTIYGVFVEGEAVCGGYAKAFKYVLDLVNINTIIIQGVGTNQNQTENHAWNYVQLDGNWYGVDCTWDDPIIVGDLTNYVEKKYYTYFLKGSVVFNEGHVPFENFYGTNVRITYPNLNENDY